jgi:hypothetical protein
MVLLLLFLLAVLGLEGAYEKLKGPYHDPMGYTAAAHSWFDRDIVSLNEGRSWWFSVRGYTGGKNEIVWIF